ncbi:CenpB-DNA-bind-domain-containing protein, partial [Aureobasidium melanogenum CBS 110374]
QHWLELEACLYEWQLQIETQVPISNELLKAAALRFWHRLPIYRDMEVPQFSTGWLDKFKKRHGITERIRHGEASLIDETLIAEQLVAI